jgi:hypothetical protein
MGSHTFLAKHAFLTKHAERCKCAEAEAGPGKQVAARERRNGLAEHGKCFRR